jgi:hypothetical protein
MNSSIHMHEAGQFLLDRGILYRSALQEFEGALAPSLPDADFALALADSARAVRAT